MSEHDHEHEPHDGPCDHGHAEEYENLLVERGEGVLTIKINRPTKMNALTRDTLMELDCVIVDAQDDPDVGAIIITGGETGKKPSFAAGADISEMSSMSVFELRSHGRLGQEVFGAIEQSAKPIIASINGFAFGGGLELALACHVFGRPGTDADRTLASARVRPASEPALRLFLDRAEDRLWSWGLQATDAAFMGIIAPSGWEPRRRPRPRRDA